MENKKEPKCLEDILVLLGSKKPFLKEPIENNESKYPFSISGGKAYGKLTSIIYGLAEMGVISSSSANDIMEELDEISLQKC